MTSDEAERLFREVLPKAAEACERDSAARRRDDGREPLARPELLERERTGDWINGAYDLMRRSLTARFATMWEFETSFVRARLELCDLDDGHTRLIRYFVRAEYFDPLSSHLERHLRRAIAELTDRVAEVCFELVRVQHSIEILQPLQTFDRCGGYVQALVDRIPTA
jgi:hypothetical protein